MNAILPHATDAQSATPPSPADLIDALNDTFGRHPGKRASHAKGFCTAGEFTPDPAAAAFAASGLFSSGQATATVRFSIGGGNPGVSDKSRSVRGMGVRLTGGGERWDLVLVSEPAFFAATPESFVSFLEARIADPVTKKPDPAKVAAHNAKYPDGKLQPALLAAHAAPASYARTPYFSNNAFVFQGPAGRKTAARILVEPMLGTQYLTEAEEAAFPDQFLEAELARRLQDGPVQFQILAQLPGPGDSLSDPSQAWSGTAKVSLGTLRIVRLAAPDACEGLVFSPMNLPSSIGPGDDPILASRHAAYGVSLARRQASGANG